MLNLQPQDSRRYFMLPQAPADAGYYVYGTPGAGAFHYAHPSMISVIMFVEREWAAIDHRQFGVGNISLADGPENKDHASHKNGLQVDIRPLRKDGAHAPVTWHQKDEYDQKATAKLIGIFFSHALVRKILFNDTSTHPSVQAWTNHDDHFHVAIKAEVIR
ncbi:MAG: penicillin-insensitive murein endopeptidase [Duganella sp.]